MSALRSDHMYLKLCRITIIAAQLFDASQQQFCGLEVDDEFDWREQRLERAPIASDRGLTVDNEHHPNTT